MVLFGKHLVTSAVIKSYAGDFFFKYFRIVNLRSLGEKCSVGSDIGSGESRNVCTVNIKYYYYNIIHIIW